MFQLLDSIDRLSAQIQYERQLAWQSMKQLAASNRALAAVEAISQRIDQAAHMSIGRPDMLLAALTELSPALLDAAVRYRNLALEFGADEEHIMPIISETSRVQEAIGAAFRGDKGEALRQLYASAPLNLWVATYEPPPIGRPTGMSPERRFLAELARAARKKHSGNWWVVGREIMNELARIPDRNLLQQTAFDRLYAYCNLDSEGNFYVSDKSGMSTYLRDLARDLREELSKKRG